MGGLLINGCIKTNKDCDKDRPGAYVLNIPLTITPSDSSLKIGDTLNIRMHVDNDSIYDSEGDEIVDVADFDPNASFFLARIDTYPEGEGLNLNEVIISEEYDAPYIPVSKLNTGGYFFFEIIKKDNFSTIEFDIVLKESGNYAFYAHSSIRYNSEDIIIEKRCRQLEGNVFIDWIINENSIHEDILNDSLRENIELYWSRNSGDRSSSDPYFFRVE